MGSRGGAFFLRHPGEGSSRVELRLFLVLRGGDIDVSMRIGLGRRGSVGLFDDSRSFRLLHQVHLFRAVDFFGLRLPPDQGLDRFRSLDLFFEIDYEAGLRRRWIEIAETGEGADDEDTGMAKESRGDTYYPRALVFLLSLSLVRFHPFIPAVSRGLPCSGSSWRYS